METLLWVLIVVSVLNTLGVFWQAWRGRFEPLTMTDRAIDWVYTAGMGAWAFWLLARA